MCYHLGTDVDNNLFRIEKEKNHLKSELDDVQSQCEHVTKGKVYMLTYTNVL